MSDKREEIIKVTRQMLKENLVSGTWGNASARGKGASMWITPSGLGYESLNEDNLVLLDLDGKVLAGSLRPSTEWRLHAAIYKARADCNAVVHTHSVYATAFAVAGLPIPPVVEDFAQVVGGEVAVAEYALPGTTELAENAVRSLGQKNAVLLAHHGTVGVAKDPAEALKVCLIVEKTAKIVLLAKLLGPVEEISKEDIERMRSFYQYQYGPGSCLKGEEK